MQLLPLIVLTFTAAMSVKSAPISYIFKGTATGTLNGTPFSTAAMIITAQGDTANVFTESDGRFFNVMLATSITITGVGSGTIDSEYVFDNPTGQKVGFGVTTIPNCCDIIQQVNGVYGSYDLKSAIGPIAAPANLSLADWVDVPTSLGLMTVTDMSENSFQAVVVPEPCTFPVLAMGLAGLGALRLRRTRLF